jgi:DNA-binding transcriptional regulator YbjK
MNTPQQPVNRLANICLALCTYYFNTYSTILDEVFKYAAFCHEMLQENTKKTEKIQSNSSENTYV